jgi:Lon protease-like protein
MKTDALYDSTRRRFRRPVRVLKMMAREKPFDRHRAELWPDRANERGYRWFIDGEDAAIVGETIADAIQELERAVGHSFLFKAAWFNWGRWS